MAKLTASQVLVHASHMFLEDFISDDTYKSIISEVYRNPAKLPISLRHAIYTKSYDHKELRAFAASALDVFKQRGDNK